LHLAVDCLIEQHACKDELDLSGLLLLMPGSRASRQLTEILTDSCQNKKLFLIPPQTSTLAGLPEYIFPRARLAGVIQQQFAWVQSLQRLEPEEFEHVFPERADKSDFLSWAMIAEELQKVNRELSGSLLTFADVAKKEAGTSELFEGRRWEIFEKIKQGYLEALRFRGYEDPENYRREALRAGQCKTDYKIILVGVIDINPFFSACLDSVKESVTALVHAPVELKECFDRFGSIVPSMWRDRRIDIGEEQIEIVWGPTEQALAVIKSIKSSGAREARETTIGVADGELTPFILGELAAEGCSGHDAAGVPLKRLSPGKLITLLGAYLRSNSYAHFAALLRHVDVQAALSRKLEGREPLSEELLLLLDRYYSNHLPHSLSGGFQAAGKDSEKLEAIYEALELLVSDLRLSQRSLSAWAEPISNFLIAIYGGTPLNERNDNERLIIEACEKMKGILTEYETLAAEDNAELDASEAISLFAHHISTVNHALDSDPDSFELLGWLELHLDTAPDLVIGGFNEGFVPESLNADMFLPDSLRRSLGLTDNDRRYARDAYLLSAILKSRRQVTLLAARRSAVSDPLLPSRLLFACNSEDIAKRVKVFYSSETNIEPVAKPDSRVRPGLMLPPEPLPGSQDITRMSVTAFADYLKCPYRFYLKHVLRLRVVDDSLMEMDGALFGTLAHEVLKNFGEIQNTLKNEEDIIREFLCQTLDDLFFKQFGRKPLPSVLLQKEQLAGRLECFARWQCNWADQGWEIKECEVDPAQSGVSLEAGEILMGLSGRIDRIDYNRRLNEWAVIDYKTGDSVKTPEQIHGGTPRRDWENLQLPLYRYILANSRPEMFKAQQVKFGYVVLPKSIKDTGSKWAEWSDEQFEEALEVAKEVAVKVSKQIFWPPSKIKDNFDDFALLCGAQ